MSCSNIHSSLSKFESDSKLRSNNIHTHWGQHGRSTQRCRCDQTVPVCMYSCLCCAVLCPYAPPCYCVSVCA